MAQLHIRLEDETLARAQAEAAKRGMSVAQLFRELANGGSARLLAISLGDENRAPAIQFLLDSAGALLDSENWTGAEVGVWLSDADRVARLARNPYNTSTGSEIKALLACVPQSVKDHAAQTLARVTAG